MKGGMPFCLQGAFPKINIKIYDNGRESRELREASRKQGVDYEC